MLPTLFNMRLKSIRVGDPQSCLKLDSEAAPLGPKIRRSEILG